MIIKKNDLYNFLICLFISSIPMMPLFTMYGFYALGFLVTILYLCVLLKNNKLILTKFDYLYVFLIIWTILSTQWSVSKELYLIKFMAVYLLFSVSSIKLLFIANDNDITKVLKKFFISFVIGTAIVSIICILYENPTNLSTTRLGTYLFAGEYGTRMMYTYNLEISIFILLYVFFNTKTLTKKMLYIFLIAFFMICIFLSGTRKILVGILLFGFIHTYFSNKRNFLKLIFKMMIIIICCIAIYFVIMNVDVFYNILGNRIEKAINYAKGTGIDASLRDRNVMIDYGIEYFKQHPIIGNGTNAFHVLFNIDYNQDLYAHNNFIELLCNYGIIGFSIYYSIYIIYLFSKSNSTYNIFFKSAIISLLILDYWTISYYRIHFMIFLELTAMFYKFENVKKVEN